MLGCVQNTQFCGFQCGLKKKKKKQEININHTQEGFGYSREPAGTANVSLLLYPSRPPHRSVAIPSGITNNY
jgi:hypothetical protein